MIQSEFFEVEVLLPPINIKSDEDLLKSYIWVKLTRKRKLTNFQKKQLETVIMMIIDYERGKIV